MSGGDGTQCVHGGEHGTHDVGAPIHQGPVLTSTYHLGRPEEAVPGADFYARADNPTWREFECRVGELDGGPCTVFPSGMAAIAAVLRGFTGPGRGVLLPSDGYYVARALAEEELAPLGIDVRLCATAGDWAAALAAGEPPGLVMLETPSNPGLEVCDVHAIAEMAHAAGAVLAVDNTTCTPLGQRPLDLGADLVVASDTKALSGHGDVLMGHVSAADPVHAEKVRAMRTRGGAIPGPMETWLALRGLGTLDLRLARQAENAGALAIALRDLELAGGVVRDVRWPGLVDDPSHELARKQMRRWNGVLRFTLPDTRAVSEFLSRTSLVDSATSFGGLRTAADRRARWGDAVPDGLVRLSCGIEDTDDLLDDAVGALEGL
ncbi:cystathionine gamma-lyase [Pseudonocardia nematodicida]|uniref:Cystathionine gamma-lyase n=1 Tax=Pseudonocardia nematodicida TaxID=1206997 RepID=A0ABV1K5S1_9PSEU